MFYFIIFFFVLGIIFGSFYNVVGYRLPRGESLITPSSHCTKCGHKLRFYELVPIFSYLFLGGKCSKCNTKISWFYPIFEFSSGILFSLSYIRFGFTLECLLSVVFISMLLIIIISDYQTMIIPDSVLIVFSSIIIIIEFFMSGIEGVGYSFINAVAAFIFMFTIKCIGDKIFKKESMGGGDIKLLAVFGFTLGFSLSIVSVFLAAIIGLPISIYILKKKKTHIIPFGPFLAISSIIIMLSGIDFNSIIKFLTI